MVNLDGEVRGLFYSYRELRWRTNSLWTVLFIIHTSQLSGFTSKPPETLQSLHAYAVSSICSPTSRPTDTVHYLLYV